MTFNNLTKQYLKDFQKNCVTAFSNGSKAIEMATRPSVHGYIESLVDSLKAKNTDIVIHHDAAYTKTDRPDWRLEDPNTFGIYCFGDHKSLSLSKPFVLSRKERSQIQRYLNLGRPVFVFDGLEFLFFDGSIDYPVREELIKKTVGMGDDWSSQTINPSVEIHFRNIIDNPGFRKWTESQLIEQLAIRARDLSDEIHHLLNAPVGSGQNETEEKLLASLHNLKKIIEEHHDPSLNNIDACSDFISQVLTFGLFYAHSTNPIVAKTPSEKRDAIKGFWNSTSSSYITSKLRPFKSIINELSDVVVEVNVLSDWHNEVLGVLSHAEFMGTEASGLDFHALFETFLTKFDEQARFDRGAFYTPKILSDWVVNYTNKVCVEYFSGNIFEIADKIIEPCCGTGSFIEALFRISESKNNTQVIGFEILPAPYALAHYRLSQVREEKDGNPELEIYLTDTLSDQLLDNSKTITNGFSEEQSYASKSCTPPVRIVIGNPPSSNHPAISAPRTTINSQLLDFRPPKSEIIDRQNIQKALNNEAYRFLRWCCERVLENDKGIVSLVLPGAFSRAVSFKYARKWISEKFHKVFILEIDGDARTNDATQSIFPVLQGRLVLFGVRNEGDDNSFELYHKDITNFTLDEKKSFLEKEPSALDFTGIPFSDQSYLFSPTNKYPEDEWIKYWPLVNTISNQGIFRHKCSAVKLAPSAMLFHTNQPILLRRSSELGGRVPRSSTGVDMIAKWFKGQRRPPSERKLTPDVKSALLKSANKKYISRYHFRPFSEGWVLNSDELFVALSSAPGGGTRARPEIRTAFASGAFGISVAPSPPDLGSTLTRFACFSWSLPDNDIAARGNAMVYCNYFPLKDEDGTLKNSSNVNSDLSKHFDFLGDGSSFFLFYAYALLSSPSYLETFEGALYRHSDPSSPIRIPITNNKRLRGKICLIGKEIALCEKSDHKINFSNKYTHDNVKELIDFKLVKYEYDETLETLILHSNSGELFKIENLPSDLFGLKISGHNVVTKWLRERSFPYLRRSFNSADLDDFIETLNRIEYQQQLIVQVDCLVEEIISSKDLILPLTN